MPGAQFLMCLEGRSGVYFVSNEYRDTGRFLVKIGLARSTVLSNASTKRTGGLRTRLEQYLLYYPRGFAIFGLMFTNYDKAYEVEQAIQSYLTGKGRKADFPHSRTEEWYWLSSADLTKVINQFGQDSSVPVNQYLNFNPYYLLKSNPTAGRQRKVPIMATPQRRQHETTSSATDSNPVQTTKKRKRVNPRDILMEPGERLSFPEIDESPPTSSDDESL
jgi:hypothetical protein